MKIRVELIILMIAFIAFSLYFVLSKKKEDYSYTQILEPEDELRTSIDLGDECGCGLGCNGALSKFETAHYMDGARCNTAISNQYPGDPGYFLGKTVI